MAPSIPGPIVFLVDCPTESHLQELLSVEHLNCYCPDFSDPLVSSKVVSCIIHLSPASVVSRPNYQNWMKRFGSTQHISAGHERLVWLSPRRFSWFSPSLLLNSLVLLVFAGRT